MPDSTGPMRDRLPKNTLAPWSDTEPMYIANNCVSNDLTAGFLFVFLDYSVFDVNDTMGVLGNVVLVGHQHDGISLCLQAVEHRHNFISGLRVQVAGWFIRQK